MIPYLQMRWLYQLFLILIFCIGAILSRVSFFELIKISIEVLSKIVAVQSISGFNAVDAVDQTKCQILGIWLCVFVFDVLQHVIEKMNTWRDKVGWLLDTLIFNALRDELLGEANKEARGWHEQIDQLKVYGKITCGVILSLLVFLIRCDQFIPGILIPSGLCWERCKS